MASSARVIGTVIALQGEVFIRGEDGTRTLLKLGDQVREGDVIITGANASVELESNNGDVYNIRQAEVVTLDATIFDAEGEAHNAALLARTTENTSINDAIALGGSLDDLLEETEAGLSGGLAGGGHSFVQLTRLFEGVTSQTFDFGVPEGGIVPQFTDQSGSGIGLGSGGGAEDTALVSIAGPVSVIEGQTTTAYTVSINGAAPTSNVTVALTYSGTATDGSDFTGVANVTIAAGSSSQTFTLATLDDRLAEGSENIIVTLGTITGTGGYEAIAVNGAANSVTTAIKDAPANTVPGAQSTAEDSPLVFSSANGNAIMVADVDVENLTTTVSVTNGTLTLGSVAGVTVSGNGTSSVQIAGSAAAINTALNGLSFANTSDFNGSATLTVTTNDGSLLVDTDTVAITVSQVADIANDALATTQGQAVTISVLGNDSFENAGRAITALNDSAITQGGPAVAVANGSVTLNASSQLVFTPTAGYVGTTTFQYTVISGGVMETATVSVTVASVANSGTEDGPVIQGDVLVNVGGDDDEDEGDEITVSHIIIEGVTYSVPEEGSRTVTIANVGEFRMRFNGSYTFTPAPDFNGVVPVITYKISPDDDDGGTITRTLSLTITPVADIVADTVNATEDTPITFSVLGNDSFENVAGRFITAIGGSAIVAGGAVTVANGTVKLETNGNLTFTPNLNFNGQTTFTYTVTSSGTTETATVTVNVDAVNDKPVNTLPASYITNEDTSIKLSGLSVADVDAAARNIAVTLSVASGTITAAAAGGVTVTGSGTASIVLTGNLANINTYLASVANQPTYVPVTDASGTVVLTMTTSDLGNTGIGGALTDSDTAEITINPIADPIIPDNVSVVVGAAIISTIDLNTDVGLDGKTNFTFPDGTTITSGSGSPFSFSGGLLLGVKGGGADGRIEGSESIVLNFPSGMQYISLKLKNAADDTVMLTSKLEAGDLGSSGTLTGAITTSLSGVTVSSSNLNVKLNLSFSDGSTQIVNGTVASGGTWSVAYNAGAKTIVSATLVSIVDGDLFNQGGNPSANVTFSISADMSSFAIAQDTSKTYSPDPENNNGFQIELFSTNSSPTGTSYSYPVDVYAVVSDNVGTPESITALKLSDLPTGSELSVLLTDGSYVDIVAVGGVFDLSSYTNLLTSPTNTVGVDKIFLNTLSPLPAGFSPTMTIETTDAGSTALTVIGGTTGSSLAGGDGNDYVSGGAGNDILVGGAGNDILVGGTGNDTMTGGLGADVFKWNLADNGTTSAPAVDTIMDFDTVANSDKLDLRDLLVEENSTNLSHFLHFEKSGLDTIVHVSTNGGFQAGYNAANEAQTIVLKGVDLIGGMSTDLQVIENMITNGKLITD